MEPEITTFFEGEIIGDRFSFFTRKWEATENIDKQHWVRIISFKKPFLVHKFKHKRDRIHFPNMKQYKQRQIPMDTFESAIILVQIFCLCDGR
jgi:hypothetical protein